MVMIASVIRVLPGRLVVRNRRTGEIVVVNTNINTRCFFPGDIVSIVYNGVMTRSIPPQIFSVRIRRLFPNRNCR